MEPVIVALKDEHLDRVIEIENQSFPVPWSRGMFERELTLPISSFFAVISDGRVIGYGGFWRVEDESHLINLAVDPKYRSHGYGRKLLEFVTVTAASQGAKKILLEVNKNNHRALQLYRSSGFEIVGVREKYYNNIDDAVLMEKKISAVKP